jgi:cysteine desulfurase/selenocysteine lyase
MTAALIAKSEFFGIENVAHLAAGGEAPVLQSSAAAVSRFYADKVIGMPGRVRMFETAAKARARLANLLNAAPDEIALLWNATAGLHVLAVGLDVGPGDNIVVGKGEFISLLTVWHEAGAELRLVGNERGAALDEIAAAVNDRTRAIFVSHVSYLTGTRSDLAALREIADRHGARLIVDVSHSLGAVPVDGALCDAAVACCYKWMLGLHGVGLFYVNADRWPDLQPQAIGWNSLTSEEDWREQAAFDLKPGLERFEGGNPSLPNIYFLENSLARLALVGSAEIERHILALGGELRSGLKRLKLNLLTPEKAEQRAGNICFATDKFAALEEHLRANGIVTWADDGRLRLSVHAYNDAADIDRALAELARVLG